jgi:hypothetical protein
MSDLKDLFFTSKEFILGDGIRHSGVIRSRIFVEDDSHPRLCKCDECKVQGFDRFGCSLCDCCDMTLHGATQHSREEAHKRKLQELETIQDDAISTIVRWTHIHERPECKRLKEADHKSLPDNVLAAVYRFIASNTAPERRVHFRQAVGNLVIFEHAERLTLLWLAVWKAECLQQFPVISDLFTAQKWFASEWKKQKLAQRQSRAMNTIVSLVSPFVQCFERKSHGKRKSDEIS